MQSNINKDFLNMIIDDFEANVYEGIEDNFNKRSSVTKRGGRPYTYSPKEICDRMVMYFRNCVEYDKPFTITGLCMKIGISREWFLKLEKCSNNQFVDTIKRGKLLMEFYWEMQAHLMPNPAWAIFMLKNFGWSDRVIIENKPRVGMSDKERTEAQERIKNFSEL